MVAQGGLRSRSTPLIVNRNQPTMGQQMKLHVCFILSFLSPLLAWAGSRLTVQEHPVGSPSVQAQTRVPVPEGAAALVRPMLDLREASVKQCGEPGTPSRCANGVAYQHELARERRISELLVEATERQGTNADEALVVLMCFYVGESQEEEDAVIKRGRRMIPLLDKYRHAVPSIPNRTYPGSMLKDASTKEDVFRGAIAAIERQRHGTWDSW
jgi:hypothetical protein